MITTYSSQILVLLQSVWIFVVSSAFFSLNTLCYTLCHVWKEKHYISEFKFHLFFFKVEFSFTRLSVDVIFYALIIIGWGKSTQKISDTDMTPDSVNYLYYLYLYFLPKFLIHMDHSYLIYTSGKVNVYI